MTRFELNSAELGGWRAGPAFAPQSPPSRKRGRGLSRIEPGVGRSDGSTWRAIADVVATISTAVLCLHFGPANADLPEDRPPASGREAMFQPEPMQLAQAVDSLARAASVRLSRRGGVPDVAVQPPPPNVEFREALQRLLSGYSYILIDRSAERAPDSSRQPQFDLVFLSPESGDATDELSEAAMEPYNAPVEPLATTVEELADRVERAASAEERADAVDALAYRAVNDESEIAVAKYALERALSDPDERVRRQTLTTLKDTAGELPFDTLFRMASEDVSIDVRLQALELAVERASDDASATLKAALADLEPAVRERAQELIAEWHITL